MESLALFQRLAAADQEYRAAMRALQEQGGELARKSRESLGLTQRELAKKIGIDYTYVSKIECGRTPPSKPFLLGLTQLMTHMQHSEVNL